MEYTNPGSAQAARPRFSWIQRWAQALGKGALADFKDPNRAVNIPLDAVTDGEGGQQGGIFHGTKLDQGGKEPSE